MTVIPGSYEIIATVGMAYTRTFTFYYGTQLTGTPFDFSGKNVYLEVKDTRRNRIIKTYETTIQSNIVTFDVPAIDLEPGQFQYRLVVVSGGRKMSYITSKFIVNV